VPKRLIAALVCALSYAAAHPCATSPDKPDSVPVYTFQIVHAYPHDPHAFTQGLEYRDGALYESTGLHGRSTLRREQLETGKVLQEISLPSEYFGEGITVLRDRILQLTWQSHTGFIYDRAAFRLLDKFTYPGEGWGLTHDAQTIYMSDGTAQLRLLDPANLAETRRIAVHDGPRAIDRLNELEFVRGEIYANIWGSDCIARISPADGRILGWIDLTGLLAASESAQSDVLNGIAYDSEHDRLFVTGKLWPKLFELRLVLRKES
jgi:glutaminyl-peptide cyclotransferase